MMNRRRALMAGKKGRLPAEYQEIEWLESYQYTPISESYMINTNQRATYQTELQMIVAYVGDVETAGRNIITARPSDSGATNAMIIAAFSASKIFGFGFFGTWYPGITRDNNFHEYIVSNARLTIDGTLYGTPNVSSGDTGRTLWIFGENAASRYSAHAQRLKQISIKQNGVLAFDAFPCYRKSDGKNGFYDLVSNSFFTCTGENLFTKGPNV